MRGANEKEYWDIIWMNFREGDRRAFQIIYDQFVDALFAYGMKMTTNRELVKDAIHDTFLDAYQYGNNLRNPGLIEFYLYKTLKHILIRKLKQQYRTKETDFITEKFDLIFPLELSETEEHEEYIRLLRAELQNLDSKKRELLYLKFSSGLTYNEIGELVNCKADTVKKQVHRILDLLRSRLGKDLLSLFLITFNGRTESLQSRV